VEDLTDEWGVVLEQRFAMYRQLREETLRVRLETHPDCASRRVSSMMEAA
jgi:hypothetical protein